MLVCILLLNDFVHIINIFFHTIPLYWKSRAPSTFLQIYINLQKLIYPPTPNLNPLLPFPNTVLSIFWGFQKCKASGPFGNKNNIWLPHREHCACMKSQEVSSRVCMSLCAIKCCYWVIRWLKGKICEKCSMYHRHVYFIPLFRGIITQNYHACTM